MDELKFQVTFGKSLSISGLLHRNVFRREHFVFWLQGRKCRVSKGISAQASHRTVLASLNAHGSSCCKNSNHYSLILLNSILFLNKEIVFVSSNKQAKPPSDRSSGLASLHFHYRNFITTTI